MWIPTLLALALAQTPSAHYHISVHPGDEPRVDVELVLSALGDREELSLRMAEGVTYVTLDEPLFTGELESFAEDGGLLPIERLSAREWKLTTLGNDSVRLTWSVPHTFRSIPEVAERDAYEFPYIAKDHGMLATWTLFPAPAEGPEVEWSYRVDVDSPAGWPVHTAWPIISTGGYMPRDREALRQNYIAVGAWDVERVLVERAVVAVLFAPGQEALQYLVRPRLGPIVKHELGVFGHRPFERYLVLFGQADMAGWGGSPKQGSMTLFADPTFTGPGGADAIMHLIAHEFFHTWAASLFDTPDELRFFSEGFTDYYAYLVPVRLGQRSWEDLGGDIAQACVGFENNPAAEMGLVECGGDVFFADPGASRLAYEGGLVVAALTDLALQRRGKRLDEFMRGIINAGGTPGLTSLIEAWRRELGDQDATFLEELLEPDGYLALEDALLNFDVVYQRTEGLAELSLRVNFVGTSITGIDPAGTAHLIGLRSGDDLRRVNGVGVENESQIRRVWRKPVDGVIEVEFERAGTSMNLKQVRPTTISYEIDGRPWNPEVGEDV